MDWPQFWAWLGVVLFLVSVAGIIVWVLSRLNPVDKNWKDDGEGE